MSQPELSRDYARIETAIRLLSEQRASQPGLPELAGALGVSQGHCQRLFRRWAGVSPKQFLQYLTVDYAKRRLEESASVLDAALASGLSGPGRLHDHFVVLEALTPGEFKNGAAGLEIGYGVAATPFGAALLAWTRRGICRFEFVEDAGEDARQRLRERFPQAALRRDDAGARSLASRSFAAAADGEPLRLHVGGTNFQLKVWRALLAVPPGCLTSYGDLARRIGAPKAARAVGSAVGANPVGYLIPCHRVIRRLGVIGEYRWGAPRKRSLLAWEAAQFVQGRESAPLAT